MSHLTTSTTAGSVTNRIRLSSMETKQQFLKQVIKLFDLAHESHNPPPLILATLKDDL